MKLKRLLFPEAERKNNLSNKIYKANGDVKNVSDYNMQHFYSKADIKMIKDSESEMITVAHDKAEKIVVEARENAEKIIQMAEGEADKIRAAAREVGYKEGYEKVSNELADKFDQAIVATEQIRDHLFDNIGAVYAEIKEQIVDLAVEIAQKIIQRNVELDRTLIIDMISNCLKLTKDKTEIVIKVNPLDYDMVEEKKDFFYRRIRGIQSVIVEETEAVLQGGCIVETKSGDINADIAEQLLKIKEAVSE